MIEQLNEYQTRLQRLEQLKAAGVIPYANKYDKQHSCNQLSEISKTSKLSEAETLMKNGAKQTYSTAGRMILFRTMGKLSFATLRDHSGDIQIAFVKDLCQFNTGKDVVSSLEIDKQEITAYKFAEKFLDIGDFVGVKGELFITKHGELTLFVDEFQLLSKALRPLGDKRHGVKDEEKIYRQRYLDLTVNSESYKRFLLRSEFIKALRNFYRSHDFIEIETPILGNAASGAAAKPFITHHNDFDEDFYLRIAPETGLKKTTVGRFERIFEIGKQFRNEGSDPSHLQEFTSAEHYAVYRNYEDNMRFTEEMFDYIFKQLQLNKKLNIKDKDGKEHKIDFNTPWERIDYVAGVKEKSGIDISTYQIGDEKKLIVAIKEKGHQREGMETQGVTTLIDYLYKKVLRPTILGPAFVYNYPKTMQPLARQNDKNNNLVEQFQLVVNGWEIVKAYSELVDPVIQQANFDEQAAALTKGDEETTSGDDDFVLSMEHGMPPQSGRGMGIDRIITLLTQQDNLRDSILFPLMKPLHSSPISVKINKVNKIEKSNSGTTPEYEQLPTKEQAEQLVESYLTDTKQHCQQVGEIMKYFAKQLKQDEHLRYLAGLLHDIDRDYIGKDASQHLGGEFEKIVGEIDLPAPLIEDIRSHYEETGVPVNSLLRKYLASVDELSGFIHAYSLMRPTGLEGMKWKSLNKKIKDKSFAAGVHRESLRYCETYLDIPLSEFALQVVNAMQATRK